jgi:hypothetical protein
MKHRSIRVALAVLLAVLFGPPTAAHFLWIHVVPGQAPRVEVLFGDGVHQDTDASLVRYVEGAQVWVPGGAALELKVNAFGLAGALPQGADLVAAHKDMGIFQRPGQGEAVKLDYEAKGALDLPAAGRAIGLETELLAHEKAGELVLEARFRGEPAAGATVFLPRWTAPGMQEVQADSEGRVTLPRPTHGVFHAKVRVVVPKPGEHAGQPYAAEHHYGMLTISNLDTQSAGLDREAWQRLEEAQRFQARLPADVIGLAGVLAVELDGAPLRGEFEFQGGRLVQCDVPSLAPESRTTVAEELRRLLEPLFQQGFAESSYAWTLTARDGHPLGRRIQAESPATCAYRVLEGEVRSTERWEGEERTLEQVLARTTAADGRILPTTRARSRFDASGALIEAAAIVDDFDQIEGGVLPKSRLVQLTRPSGTLTLLLELRNLEIERQTDTGSEDSAR